MSKLLLTLKMGAKNSIFQKCQCHEQRNLWKSPIVKNRFEIKQLNIVSDDIVLEMKK